jgi:excinuclease ABC subunit C
MPSKETSDDPATAPAEIPRRPAGPDVIAAYVKHLPSTPGVYRMLDVDGQVIYVGKARSLKARVTSYTRLAGHTNRIARMILGTAAMEFVSVRTEAEALLLEANLIKRFRPRFNVLMRDDKSFPYILIARNHGAVASGQPKRQHDSAVASGQPKRQQDSAVAGGQPKRQQNAPQILKHRGARTRKGDYFGPFASAGAVDRTINMLQRAFLLRSCSDSVYESRTRPCLLFQIKRCSAPCTGEITREAYDALVDEAVRFLKGESQSVRQMYQTLMEEAAARLEFEDAAKYRNRLWALAHVTSDQAINPDGIEEADVFAAHQEGGQTCIQVFFFRAGQNWGNRAYYPKADRAIPVEEVLDAFVAQFYDDKPVPRLILLSHDVPSRSLLAEALSTKAERRVEIRCPQRGAKSGLVDHALTNAREALGRKLAESSSQRLLLQGVADRFGLAATPRRIEVYDNSHISGTHAVGAMIVAGPEGLAKGQYRKFNIKSTELAPGDDYAMMREVLTRRLKRLVVGETASAAESAAAAEPPATFPQKAEASAETPGDITIPGAASSRIEAPPETSRGQKDIAFSALPLAVLEHAPPGLDGGESAAAETEEDTDAPADVPDRPDLILIDGGAGQLAVASEVMAELGLADIALVGVAKGPDRDAGREHFHIPGRPKPFMLEPRDPVLYFVQRLRDEAHRFAILTHRARRSKAIGVNPLDEIEGIGPTRKRALLKHFGSAKAVSRAGVEDLKAVTGISAEMAQRIYDFFHDKAG